MSQGEAFLLYQRTKSQKETLQSIMAYEHRLMRAHAGKLMLHHLLRAEESEYMLRELLCVYSSALTLLKIILMEPSSNILAPRPRPMLASIVFFGFACLECK